MSIFLEYMHKFRHGQRIIAERRLQLIKKALKKSFLNLDDYTDDEHQPYIYVYDPARNLSFGGIRIYTNNDIIAFRAQKMPDTQPYGAAYQLDIQQMLEDLMENSQERDKNKLAELLIKLLGTVIREFFIKSSSAENDLTASITSNMPTGVAGNIAIKNNSSDAVVVRNTGTDYANYVTGYNK